jgi:hypothetical protein
MKINDLLTEAVKQRLDPKCWDGKHKEGTKIKGGVRVNNCVPNEAVEEDWNKVNHHDKTDGLSQKAVKAYRRENPGSKLQTAVTTKPSKLKAGSKDAKRRKSFCARMSGNNGPMKDEKGRPTPKAKALSRWNCESMYEGEGDPEGVPHLTPELVSHILEQMEDEGAHAITKSIEWGDGAAHELTQLIKAALEDYVHENK